MIASHQKNTNIGVGLGLVLNFGGVVVGGGIGPLMQLAGTCLFIWGCYSYAKAKGRHGAWALLGFLSIFGLIGLALMKDRCPDGDPVGVTS